MSDEVNSSNELRERMAEYLGGEMTPDQAARYEAALAKEPQTEAEVEGLKGALESMRRLDSEPPAMPSTTMKPLASRWNRGHALRIAAMIALGFFFGYIIRGLEPAPASTPSADPNSGIVEQAPVEEESFVTRYAAHYLSDTRRSGFGRSLIAYSKSMEGGPSDGRK